MLQRLTERRSAVPAGYLGLRTAKPAVQPEMLVAMLVGSPGMRSGKLEHKHPAAHEDLELVLCMPFALEFCLRSVRLLGSSWMSPIDAVIDPWGSSQRGYGTWGTLLSEYI